MKTNLIINLVPICSGGGLQNANSLIETFGFSLYEKDDVVFLVRSGSEIEKICQKHNISYLSIRATFIDRFIFEFFSKNYFSKNSICFTLFGPPPISSFGRSINIVGCAYSNLFYPDIPFWSYLPLHKRLIKRAIDTLRRNYTEAADFWIFETDALRRRAIELCNFPEDRVAVVRMAPSKLVSKAKICPEKYLFFKSRIASRFKILFLSGAHPNKRLHLLPAIAKKLFNLGHSDFIFITTIDESLSYSREVFKAFDEKNISEHIYNVGPVSSVDVATIINFCDAMCTFSLLESFSNNFIEAWQMEIPLVVTDADWSRGSCGAAALYINPEDPSLAASLISQLISHSEIRDRLVAAGRDQLLIYNTPETKLNKYFEIIEKAANLGPLCKERRKQIRWP